MNQPPCYRHPDRPAGSVCRRCNRPICPSCMLEAPVGWQCPSCVREGARVSPVRRWRPAAAGSGRLGNSRITLVVTALIVVNIAVYIWEGTSGSGLYSFGGVQARCAQVVVCKYGLIPTVVHHGQWYRLITAAFLHANIEHIAFNMFTLAIVGAPIEAELGRVRFLSLYLVSALGGSVASYLLSNPNQIGVGASGAIFGLMGAYFVLARRSRWDTSSILGLIIINLVIGFASSTIDWRAHLGGLFVGAGVAAGMSALSSTRLRVVAGTGVAAAAAVVLALLATLPPGHVNL